MTTAWPLAAGSNQASPAAAWHQGGGRRGRKDRRSPSAAIQEGFHPTTAPKRPGSGFSQLDGAFPWWGWRDPAGAPVSLGWLGAAFGLEGGA